MPLCWLSPTLSTNSSTTGFIHLVSLASVPSDELGKRVADWLRSESYPLEMTVGRGLRDAGFAVTQSDQYIDVEADKLREMMS